MQLAAAKKALQEVKGSCSGVQPAQQAKLDSASLKGAKVFKKVGDELAANPEHELVQLLHDAHRLQPHVATMNKNNLVTVETLDRAALYKDLQDAHDRLHNARTKLVIETTLQKATEEAQRNIDEEMASEEDLERGDQLVHDAPLRVELGACTPWLVTLKRGFFSKNPDKTQEAVTFVKLVASSPDVFMPIAASSPLSRDQGMSL
jgi:hypothetical protein